MLNVHRPKRQHIYAENRVRTIETDKIIANSILHPI